MHASGHQDWRSRCNEMGDISRSLVFQVTLGIAAAGVLGGLISSYHKAKSRSSTYKPDDEAEQKVFKRKTKAEKKIERYYKSKEHFKKRDALRKERHQQSKPQYSEEEIEFNRTRRAQELKQMRERIDAVHALDVRPPGGLREGNLTPHLRVAIDLSYGKDVNVDREIRSLNRQLTQSWNHMRLAKSFKATPSLHLTSYVGEVVQVGLKQGVSSWKVHRHQQDLMDVFPRESLVYLSPDATHVLEEIDHSKVYVIGGIVDRTVKKHISLSRAEQLGVATARLPLHLTPGIRGQKVLVLNVDTVLKILMEYEERHNWTEAIVACIPQRKLVYPQEKEIIKKAKVERKTSAQKSASAAQEEGPSGGGTGNEPDGEGDDTSLEVSAKLDGGDDEGTRRKVDMNDSHENHGVGGGV